MKAHLNKILNLEHSIHAIIERLRLFRQKTTKISQFEAHFGRRCNTPISNTTTKSSNKNLSYNKIIKYRLDKDTVPGRLYLTDELWAGTGMCSHVEIEKVICAAKARAHDEQQNRKDEESRLVWSEGISRPIPRSEGAYRSRLDKIHAAHRQKKRP